MGNTNGADTAATLSNILTTLDLAGFPKARIQSYTFFDRVLSGITWLLQHLVRREDADGGRVQWDVLFYSHDKMKARLGLAQDVVRCVHALSDACPVAIQPHQLLLEDFGDIATVQKLVVWLADQKQHASHLATIRRERAYLEIMSPTYADRNASLTTAGAFLSQVYAPKRQWQYIAGAENGQKESDEAMIQRCLLEYGERVIISMDGDELEMDLHEANQQHQIDCMAQLAGQAAAVARSGVYKPRESNWRRRSRSAISATEFSRQYEQVMKKAQDDQRMLLEHRRTREVKLLQRVVRAPHEQHELTKERYDALRESTALRLVRAQLQQLKQQVQQLIDDKTHVNQEMERGRDQATALSDAIAALTVEMETVAVGTSMDAARQAQMEKLRALMEKCDEMKRERRDFRAKCRLELQVLGERVEKMKLQVADDVDEQKGGALRMREIEQMHAQMAQRHRSMKSAVAKQARAVQCKMKHIDEIPSRMELVQYEKRFVELYDEVALTLDETRKYYCVYNTLKTTLEYTEKEILLISSISENLDVAMSSKTATQAFFMQIENVIQNMQDTVTKQQTTRDAHQSNVEKLDSMYQLLLEQERTYVNAIRDFRKSARRTRSCKVE